MSDNRAMRTITGLPTARGYASGPVFLYRKDGDFTLPEYLVEPGHESEELLRLNRALGLVIRDIENLISVLKDRTGRADVRVFECHQMMLEDPMLRDETVRYIRDSRLNAESAVRKTANGARAQFERMNDPYFRERVRDIDDIERRLLYALTGYNSNPLFDLNTPSIIVANDLTPSETVQLPREFTLGIATDGGSPTSHVALLARALGIPAVTGLGDVSSQVVPGEKILLDGTNGAVTVNPDEKASADFDRLISREREIVSAVLSGEPAGTLREGGEVKLLANMHPGIPLAGIREFGARGIGLYRSEYLWLNRGMEPTEDEQYEAYASAVRFAKTLDKTGSVTIRVLDIGGDKTVEGITAREANPFLGNRSIRYLLANREVFRTQLRAILRASSEGHVCILYPMVSCVEEVRQANAVLEGVKRELDAENVPYDRDILVGAMIEVPAAALNAEAIGEEVDLFSIGTNDLIQYTMAADRGNESVAHLYQPTNQAVIKLMRMTVAAAKKNEIWVSICGESAADPIIGVLWAAMGVDALSMSAGYIPVLSKLLSRLTRAQLNDYSAHIRDLPPGLTAHQVFGACKAWMRKNIPDLDEILV